MDISRRFHKPFKVLVVAAGTLVTSGLALHQLGLLIATLSGHGEVWRAVGAAAAFTALATVAGFVWHRYGRSQRVATALALLGLALGSYGLSLRSAPGIQIAGVFRPQPGTHEAPPTRWLPATTYTMNAKGFRGEQWPDSPAADVQRVVVIGDSFVWGQGVDEVATLPARLQAALRRAAPGRNVEVRNLGIAGNNLGGNVAVARMAVRDYQPGVVVFTLNLPNDLNPWDAQRQYRAGGRPSAFSLLAWLLQPYTAMLICLAVSEPDEALGREIARQRLGELADLAAAHPQVTFVLYAYQPTEPWLEEITASRPQLLPVAACLPGNLAAWFPMDGHPTSGGNAHHAERLAPFIARALGWNAGEGAASPLATGSCRAGGDHTFGPWRANQDLGNGMRIIRLEPHDDQLMITVQTAHGPVSFDVQPRDLGHPAPPFLIGGLQLAFRKTTAPRETVGAAGTALVETIRRAAGNDAGPHVLRAWLAGQPAPVAATPTGQQLEVR